MMKRIVYTIVCMCMGSNVSKLMFISSMTAARYIFIQHSAISTDCVLIITSYSRPGGGQPAGRSLRQRAAAPRLREAEDSGAGAHGGQLEHGYFIRATNNPSVFTIVEKAPTRAFSWLKVPTSAFTFKKLLVC